MSTTTNMESLKIHTEHQNLNTESLLDTNKQGSCGNIKHCLSQNIFSKNTRQELREIVRLAWPTILSSALTFSISTQSLLFAGHLGETELAAATLAISFVNVTGFSVALGLCAALETLCSQAYGAGNYIMVGTVLQRGICVLGIAMILTYAFWVNTEQFLLAVGVEHKIARMVDGYILMAMPLLPPLFGQILLQRYLQMQGIVLPILYIGIVVNILTIGINFLFVNTFGLGLRGVAVANYLAFYLFFILIIAYILVKKLHVRTWKGWSIDCLLDWGQFVSLALPGMLMICLEWWSFEIGSFIMSSVSESSLAAHGVLFQLGALTYMIPLGTSVAASIRVGNVLGANLPSKAKLIMKLSIGLTISISVVMVAIIVAAREEVGKAFSNSREVIDLVSRTIPLMAVFTFFDATQGVCSGIIRGCGRQKTGVVINFISYDVIALPLGITLVFVFSKGLAGIWWGLTAGLFVQAVTYVTVLMCTNWKRQARLALQRAAVAREDIEANGDLHPLNPGNGSTDPVAARLCRYASTTSFHQSYTDQASRPRDFNRDHVTMTATEKQSLVCRRTVPLVIALSVLAASLAVRLLLPVSHEVTNSTTSLNQTVLPTLLSNGTTL